MISFLFLCCWTAGFTVLGLLVWKRCVHRKRLYILLLVNLAFLAGLFWLYPVVTATGGRL